MITYILTACFVLILYLVWLLQVFNNRMYKQFNTTLMHERINSQNMFLRMCAAVSKNYNLVSDFVPPPEEAELKGRLRPYLDDAAEAEIAKMRAEVNA